jgi:hypothetical protein
MNSYAVTLTPFSYEGRARSLTLGEQVWRRAVLLVEQAGCRLNSHSGLDRRSTSQFTQLLCQQTEKLDPSDHSIKDLADLTTFMAGVGACGFTLTRGFKRWDQ